MEIPGRASSGGKKMNRLVKKAQSGDADAFIELIEMNKMTLQRVAFGYFRDEEDVADVIQDTILDAFEHLQELKKTEYFKTWLVRILMDDMERLIYRRVRTSILITVCSIWKVRHP